MQLRNNMIKKVYTLVVDTKKLIEFLMGEKNFFKCNLTN